MGEPINKTSEVVSDDRRKFLKNTGRFAAATPPAVALLLSTTLEANAIAASSDGRGDLKLKRRLKRRLRKKLAKKRRKLAKRKNLTPQKRREIMARRRRYLKKKWSL